MEIRTACADDLEAMVSLAAPLQARPDRHVAYLSIEGPAMAEELRGLGDWAAVSAVIDGPDPAGGRRLAAWLVGEVDAELGRVWWWGPFVDPGATDEATWAEVVTVLYRHAAALLPDGITEQEVAVDERHVDLAAWATGNGFTADTGSAVLVLANAVPVDDPPAGRPVIRPPRAGDREVIGPLHDRLFPSGHLPGSRLLDEGDGQFRRVAEVDGRPVGYVAFERTADGEAYIDLLGVDPDQRRGGIGRALALTAVAEGRAIGCHQTALTVRADNDGARRLYRSIGFDEERVLLPLRIGFTAAE